MQELENDAACLPDNKEAIAFEDLTPEELLSQAIQVEGTQEEQEGRRTSVKPMFHYANEKAGMEGLNRDEINKRIMEASKGSSYYQREEDRALMVKKKVKHLKVKLESYKQNT